ncbi:HAMP domain-containing histidine kinase [Acetobacteraceae bacterium H6797]|nr:HAMP domain-containing histidine kinase [Acetobacteraceae bacterium H6797]
MLQLVELRWLAVFGQVLTITVVHFGLGIELPLPMMAMVLVALVVLNVLSMLRLQARRSVTNPELFLSISLDVAALTAQLYLSGGATNPFISLYLLQVVLTAVLLDMRWSLAILALTGACYLLLIQFYIPFVLPAELEGQLFRLHLQGLVVCFLLDSVLVSIFVARIRRNLAHRDERLAALRQQKAEEDHIVRMGLLASGAAHELGTPLATVLVLLGDWRRMAVFKEHPDLLQDIEEAEAAILRCKTIVTGVLTSAGEVRGEAPSLTTVKTFLDDLVEEWRAARGFTGLTYRNDFGEDMPIISDPALKQVLANILDNAQEAPAGRIHLAVRREDDHLSLSVEDDGPGFPPDMLERVGRPYQSSKGKTGGGLGLFLVVNVVRKLGGTVTVGNRPEGGARVALRLPLAALAVGGYDEYRG